MPIENIIVQKDGNQLIVKEGNRRIASLKICLGYLNIDDLNFPKSLRDKVSSITKKWIKSNYKIACSVYLEKEKDRVNRIVSLVHGKGQRASRDPWEAIAKARYNRDENGKNEPGLTVLDKYISLKNPLSDEEVIEWSGNYPISILDEALKKIAPVIGCKNAVELSSNYPKISKIKLIDRIILEIGRKEVGFKEIRKNKNEFLDTYGFHEPDIGKETNTNNGGSNQKSNSPSPNNSSENTGSSSSFSGDNIEGNTSTSDYQTNDNNQGRSNANANNTLRAVHERLREFSPKGPHREKVVTLRNEMQKLNIRSTPIAFCFLLRSAFEISAKAYCKENSIRDKTKNGQDMKLVDILRKCVDRLTENMSDRENLKILHGAMTEIAKKDGILSITSLNQLIHNPTFSIQPPDIAILFGNVYPLLEKLND